MSDLAYCCPSSSLPVTLRPVYLLAVSQTHKTLVRLRDFSPCFLCQSFSSPSSSPLYLPSLNDSLSSPRCQLKCHFHKVIFPDHPQMKIDEPIIFLYSSLKFFTLVSSVHLSHLWVPHQFLQHHNGLFAIAPST